MRILFRVDAGGVGKRDHGKVSTGWQQMTGNLRLGRDL